METFVKVIKSGNCENAQSHIAIRGPDTTAAKKATRPNNIKITFFNHRKGM